MSDRSPHLPLPPVVHPDAGTLLIGSLYAGAAERQREMADAILGEWRSAGWPMGFLGVRCFASTDEETVLSYAQWTDDRAHRAHVLHRPPGIGPAEPVRYRLYRSLMSPLAPESTHCLVTAAFDVDGSERQRYFVDALIAAQPRDAYQSGAGAAHFLLSADGSRVLLYTEWASERAHHEAAATGAHDKLHDLFSATPGVRSLRGRRYHLYAALEWPRS